ncbi:MAG TPA: hypothetical protein HA224_01420 [Nanoarchaeota archaeon]|nr:hypothetical protein [Nanoarchaeota archaeon]
MAKLNEKQTAFGLGSFAAVIHILWALVVLSGNGPWLVNWITGLHFLNTSVTVLPFDWMTAITLIIVTFIVGYLLGWLFACTWNWSLKQKRYF